MVVIIILLFGLEFWAFLVDYWLCDGAMYFVLLVFYLKLSFFGGKARYFFKKLLWLTSDRAIELASVWFAEEGTK